MLGGSIQQEHSTGSCLLIPEETPYVPRQTEGLLCEGIQRSVAAEHGRTLYVSGVS